MAKQRYINTRFWSDEWIGTLDPTEKLLYLYLLTNERTTIAGIYELPLKIMAVETGIEMETIGEILRRFKKDKKIIIADSWIRLTNFPKYQDNDNPKIKAGIDNVMSEIPFEIKIKLYPTNRVSIPTPYPPNNLNSNSNSNININKIPPTIEEVTKYCEERKNGVNPSKWHDFYSSKGWMVGRNKMKDWRAAVRTWEKESAPKKVLPEGSFIIKNGKPVKI